MLWTQFLREHPKSYNAFDVNQNVQAHMLQDKYTVTMMQLPTTSLNT